MKAHRSIGRLLMPLLAAGCTALLACARTELQPPRGNNSAGVAAGVTAESVTALTEQLETTRRYAARMEELYAAQEAEILALRQQVAKLRGQ